MIIIIKKKKMQRSMCFYGAYAQTSLQVMTFHSQGGDQLDQPRCLLYTKLRNKFATSESKELS